jgi:hypothetical protein
VHGALHYPINIEESKQYVPFSQIAATSNPQAQFSPFVSQEFRHFPVWLSISLQNVLNEQVR